MNKGTVTLNAKRVNAFPNGEIPIDLRNGSLVIHRKRNKDVLGVYIVTSFRDSTGNYKNQATNPYCTFIDLETGYIKFEERCSRNTTLSRVLSHLNKGNFKGEEALKRGEYIEVFRRDKYELNLSYSVEDNEGWKQ